jgi:septation ring formation regulator EzrA
MFNKFQGVEALAGQLKDVVSGLEAAFKIKRQNLKQAGAAVFNDDCQAVFESLNDLESKTIEASKAIKNIRKRLANITRGC